MLLTLTTWVVSLCLLIAIFGLILNMSTLWLLATRRAYRLSAYTIMANVAFVDSVTLLVAGVACGLALLIGNGWSPSSSLDCVLAVGQISSWASGVLSYAYLGLNRCVAIRYYGTPARQLNQPRVALLVSALSWALGLALASISVLPWPPLAPRITISPLRMWTVGSVEGLQRREALLTGLCLGLLAPSVCLQWVCSILVLLKIRHVRRRIAKDKLGPDSAQRFRKQARLTFQFFYPSLLCTASSVLHLAKPSLHRHFRLGPLPMIGLHLLWLLAHVSNPIIYAYFNERMRASYLELLSCLPLRAILIRRKRKYFDDPLGLGVSGRLCVLAGLPLSRQSTKRRTAAERDGVAGRGNFVRTSLQMQSRDFEQLCEFMMRVSLANESSEGWRDSALSSGSSASSGFSRMRGRSEGLLLGAVGAIRRLSGQSGSTGNGNAPWVGGDRRQQQQREPSQSVVLLQMGRQTVEHWARFAKKASI